MSPLLDIVARLLTSKNSQLHRAVSMGDVVELKSLLEQGACVHHMPRSGSEYTGDSPVHIAVRNNDLACLRVLVEHGACVNSVGMNRKPPLAYWFDCQQDALHSGGRVENLPQGALEVGDFLLQSGAKLGKGGRASMFSGRTPQDRIDMHPALKRLQEYMQGAYQADQRAKALQSQAPLVSGRRPRSRF